VNVLVKNREYIRDSNPNCWNATLLYYGATSKIEYCNPYFMDEWLEENGYVIDCSKRQKHDVLVIEDGYELLQHTAVYVGDDMYWHKQGLGGMWEYMSMKDMQKLYPGIYYHMRISDTVSKVTEE
jgi:hypothetical protein